MKGRSGSRDLRGLMGETLGKHRLNHGVRKARAVLLWPQAVGPELARLTRPRGVTGSMLFVEVRDSAHAHSLTMQRHHFLKRLHELLGDESVTELRFVVGQFDEPLRPAAPSPLPPPDARRARELSGGVPEPLRGSALLAAEAITRARRWRESQGYRPCPVCGEATPEQPCHACSLTLQDPLVGRAAGRLARDPGRLGHLSDELGASGADAARYLALHSLAEQLDVLALECAREGGESYYRDFLRQQAEVYVALTRRAAARRLSVKDRELLPARVAAVLAAGR